MKVEGLQAKFVAERTKVAFLGISRADNLLLPARAEFLAKLIKDNQGCGGGFSRGTALGDYVVDSLFRFAEFEDRFY